MIPLPVGNDGGANLTKQFDGNEPVNARANFRLLMYKSGSGQRQTCRKFAAVNRDFFLAYVKRWKKRTNTQFTVSYGVSSLPHLLKA